MDGWMDGCGWMDDEQGGALVRKRFFLFSSLERRKNSSHVLSALHHTHARTLSLPPPWPGAASCPRICRSCGEWLGVSACVGRHAAPQRAAPPHRSALSSPFPSLSRTHLFLSTRSTASTCARPRPPARAPGKWVRNGVCVKRERGDDRRRRRRCCQGRRVFSPAVWRAHAHRARPALRAGGVSVSQCTQPLERVAFVSARTHTHTSLCAHPSTPTTPPAPPFLLSLHHTATSSPPTSPTSNRPTRASLCWYGRPTVSPRPPTPGTTRASRPPSRCPAWTRRAWRPRSGGWWPKGRSCPAEPRARGRCRNEGRWARGRGCVAGRGVV